MCSRYPLHHCRACCPAETMLLAEAQQPNSTNDDDPVAAFGSPLCGSPMEQSQAADCCEDDRATPDHDDASFMNTTSDDSMRRTPDSRPTAINHTTIISKSTTTPRMPPAPSKSTSHDSATSRKQFLASTNNTTARSLTPLFNGFAPAANRANLLGGRFATLRPQQFSIAKLQRQMSTDASSPTSSAKETSPAPPSAYPSLSRKRPRSEGVAAEQSLSVHTVSWSKEPRRGVAAWMRANTNTNTNTTSP